MLTNRFIVRIVPAKLIIILEGAVNMKEKGRMVKILELEVSLNLKERLVDEKYADNRSVHSVYQLLDCADKLYIAVDHADAGFLCEDSLIMAGIEGRISFMKVIDGQTFTKMESIDDDDSNFLDYLIKKTKFMTEDSKIN